MKNIICSTSDRITLSATAAEKETIVLQLKQRILHLK